MFVLGIDPGLTTMGYGVVTSSAGKLEAVTVGVIRTSPASPVASRLLEIFGDLGDVINEFPIETAAIEQVFTNRNRHSASNVGRTSGVAMLAAATNNIPVVEYTPSAIKMALTGFGSADKRQVQRVVQMRLGLKTEPRPADAADALATAVCHLQASSLQRRLNGMENAS